MKGVPIRILRPRVPRGVRRLRHLVNRFVLVLALTGAVLLLPTSEGLSVEGHRALALFVLTGSILALEPVSEVARRLGSVSGASKR